MVNSITFLYESKICCIFYTYDMISNLHLIIIYEVQSRYKYCSVQSVSLISQGWFCQRFAKLNQYHHLYHRGWVYYCYANNHSLSYQGEENFPEKIELSLFHCWDDFLILNILIIIKCVMQIISELLFWHF